MKSVFAALLMLAPFFTVAQDSDTSKVEQYCAMIVSPKIFTTKVNIEVNYGEKTSAFKSNRLRDETGNLLEFNSIVDACNYMGRLGWKMVGSLSIPNQNGSGSLQFYFKKLVDRTEISKADKK